MTNPQSVPKKPRKRSASYPAFSLEEAIDATKSLKEKLGDGPYSREHMATALGYKGVTGSSGMKIASCVHFGLLERNGNTYSQSELAGRYFNYLSEEEHTQILVEAFSRPALYQKLLAEYNGKSLPQMLESIFVRNYGIQENVARSAVANFKDSAGFVGVLKNGVLNVNAHTGVAEQVGAHLPATQKNSGTPMRDGAYVDQPPLGNVVVNDHLSVTLPSGLIVSYTQELAPAFAFGIFGQKLMGLDIAITEYKKTLRSTETVSSEIQTEERE